MNPSRNLWRNLTKKFCRNSDMIYCGINGRIPEKIPKDFLKRAFEKLLEECLMEYPKKIDEYMIHFPKVYVKQYLSKSLREIPKKPLEE